MNSNLLSIFSFFSLITWTCSEGRLPEKTEVRPPLISNEAILGEIKEYLATKKMLRSKDELILEALVQNDSVNIRKLVQDQLRSASDSLITPELRELMNIEEIRAFDSHKANVYKFSVSFSLHWSAIQITFAENLETDSYNLKLLHYGYGWNENELLDIDTIFTDKTLEVQKADWERFQQLVDESYFWIIPNFDESIGLDGSNWCLEGLRQADGKYHFLEIWSPPAGAFRKVCEYVMSLTGEDLSAYSAY